MTEDDAYSPEAIRFWLSGRCSRGCRWAMLESAVEGGTGCTGMGSGHGDRFGLAHIKADLERSADSLPIYWQATRIIFAKQHREAAYSRRRQACSPDVSQREYESPIPSQAIETAIWRMSCFLGWQEGLTNVA